MKKTFYRLVCLVLFFTSCTSIPFKNPPPNDLPALAAFPQHLWGSYYHTDTKDARGKNLPAKTMAFSKAFSTFDIYRDSLVLHDYKTTHLRVSPRDSAIVALNDSLVTYIDDRVQYTSRYAKIDNEYVALRKDAGLTLALNDSVKLKQNGPYFFLSMQINSLWYCLVFKNPQPGVLHWLTAMKHTDKRLLEKRIRAITPLEPVEVNGKQEWVIDAGLVQMKTLIGQGIYQYTAGFSRK